MQIFERRFSCLLVSRFALRARCRSLCVCAGEALVGALAGINGDGRVPYTSRSVLPTLAHRSCVVHRRHALMVSWRVRGSSPCIALSRFARAPHLVDADSRALGASFFCLFEFPLRRCRLTSLTDCAVLHFSRASITCAAAFEASPYHTGPAM